MLPVRDSPAFPQRSSHQPDDSKDTDHFASFTRLRHLSNPPPASSNDIVLTAPSGEDQLPGNDGRNEIPGTQKHGNWFERHYDFRRPDVQSVLVGFTMLLVLLSTIWAFLWLVLRDSGEGSPETVDWMLPSSDEESHMFALLVLLFGAFVGGHIASSWFGLPRLLGMLMMGLLLRNVGLVDGLHDNWSAILRTVALTIILTKAGLGLSLDVLRRLGLPLLCLSVLPGLVESCSVAVMSHLLLDLPWLWAFLLGWVLAAVSPAIVVPSILKLKHEGFGVDKGIPSLLLGAASFDDVLAVSIFAVLLGQIFSSDDSVAMQILHAPLEIVGGVVGGALMGLVYFCIERLLRWRAEVGRSAEMEASAVEMEVLVADADTDPAISRDHSPNETANLDPQPHIHEPTAAHIKVWKQAHAHTAFASAVLLGCLAAVFLGRELGYTGAGALTAMISGIGVAKLCHKTFLDRTQYLVATAWKIGEPTLFVLIGASVDLADLKGSLLLKAILVMAVSLFFRSLTSLSVASMPQANLEWRERFFVMMAWLPKATVQAAIGSIALDEARKQNGSADEITYGEDVLSVAVLSIIITAPIGALCISKGGPRLLTRT